MTENRLLFESIISQIENAELSQMFGKPCAKFNKKAFLGFYEDEMVFKIGKEAITNLSEKFTNYKNWDPSGKNRPMKDWVQMSNSSKSEWENLANQAFEFNFK